MYSCTILKEKKNGKVCHLERVKAAIAHNDVQMWTISVCCWIYAGRWIFTDLSQVLSLLFFSLFPLWTDDSASNLGKQSTWLPPAVARSYNMTSGLREDETLNGGTKSTGENRSTGMLNVQRQSDLFFPSGKKKNLLLLKNKATSFQELPPKKRSEYKQQSSSPENLPVTLPWQYTNRHTVLRQWGRMNKKKCFFKSSKSQVAVKIHQARVLSDGVWWKEKAVVRVKQFRGQLVGAAGVQLRRNNKIMTRSSVRVWIHLLDHFCQPGPECFHTSDRLTLAHNLFHQNNVATTSVCKSAIVHSSLQPCSIVYSPKIISNSVQLGVPSHFNIALSLRLTIHWFDS